MLTLVPTPIGNILDISFRAVKCFESADLILCEDTRVTKKLFRLLSSKVGLKLNENAVFLSFNEHNGQSRLRSIADDISTKNTIYVSDAGMPGISDPGRLLVEYCMQEGLEYDILPGPSALTVAYVASGYEGGEFCFYGFLPKNGSERKKKLSSVMAGSSVSVVYEAPHRLMKLLGEIHRIDPDRKVFLAKEISKKFQKYYFGTISSITEKFEMESKIKGEWVVVIEKGRHNRPALYFEDIVSLDMPPKIKAKLLSKVSDKNIGYWYEKLINKQELP